MRCDEIERAAHTAHPTPHTLHPTLHTQPVDHTASATDGGYTVVTEENSILKTTGFTRFEYKLKPKEELEFVVMEEAQTSVTKMPYLGKRWV